jgi:putative nucleotidyltransferase with HDIG domain
MLVAIVGSFLIGFLAARLIYMISGARGTAALSARGKEKRHPPAESEPAPTLTAAPTEIRLWYEEETEFMFAFNESLASAVRRDKLSKTVTESPAAFLSAQGAVLLLVDKGARELKIAHHIGVSSTLLDNLPLSLNESDSIAAHVIASREPVLVNNLENDLFMKRMNREEYLKKSFVSVPIQFQGEPIGVLHVLDKQGGQGFSSKDLKFLVNCARISAISFQNLNLNENIKESYLKSIAALAAALESRDSYTRWHSENVTRYSVELARKLRCPEQETDIIRRAALLHDIGKIGIRDCVLLKPGKLNDDEFAQIKQHPAKGAEIVKLLSFLQGEAEMILQHHERYDGTGYPLGIKGNAIVLGARILAVADTFDAMISDRPYRKGLPLEIVIAELERNKSTQFDPAVADAFIALVQGDPALIRSSAAVPSP